MIIRRAELSDAVLLYELEQKLFLKENFPLSKSSFRYHIKSSLLYLAELEGRVVGYILVLVKYKNAKLYSLGVDELYRGKKIANTLLHVAFEELSSLEFNHLFLEVRVDNKRAIELYKKMGFTTKKRVKEFYGDGCDAYLMESNITKN